MDNEPDVTTRLIQALANAPDAAKSAALRILQGHPLPHQEDVPLLYTVSQAGRRLNLSRSSVWRAIRAGRLKKIEIYPGCERLRRADVEALAGGAS